MSAHKGFHHTEETKRKLSEMRRGAKNPFYGKHHTSDTIARIQKWGLARDSTSGKIAIARRTILIPGGEDLAYIAGVLDGEGSIMYVRKVPLVLIYNTDRTLIDWLLKIVGGKIRSVDNRGRVPCYAWGIGGARNVHAFVSAIRPRLLVKDETADEMLRTLEARYGKRLQD